jgi:hypothetical protein
MTSATDFSGVPPFCPGPPASVTVMRRPGGRARVGSDSGSEFRPVSLRPGERPPGPSFTQLHGHTPASPLRLRGGPGAPGPTGGRPGPGGQRPDAANFGRSWPLRRGRGAPARVAAAPRRGGAGAASR